MCMKIEQQNERWKTFKKVKEIKKLIHQLNWYKRNNNNKINIIIIIIIIITIIIILLFTYIILVIRDIWILICKCEHVQPAQWKIHYKQDINIGYKLTNYKLQLDSLKIYNNPVTLLEGKMSWLLNPWSCCQY